MVKLAAFASVIACVEAQATFNIGSWQGALADGSGVLQSLKPASDTSFDFSPADVFDSRNGVNNHHTGDVSLRFRSEGETQWRIADSAANRNSLTPQSGGNGIISTTVLGPVLAGTDDYLNVTRTWSDRDGDLALTFSVTNIADSPVEIGALGLTIEFNNAFTSRTAVDTTNKCVLVDPYIGMQAGYVQVTRLTGTGPELVITPLNNSTKLEAWRFIPEESNEPLYYQSQTYEGNYEWMVFTKAYAENEWASVEPWNIATSRTLAPDETLTVGLRLSTAPGVDQIEPAVSSKNLPVAVGIPGYVLPKDIKGRLFVNSAVPVKSIEADPANALSFEPSDTTLEKPWSEYSVTASDSAFGRVRVTITYDNDFVQTIHYTVADAASSAVDKLGEFSFSKQWYTDASDPFSRAPSVITFDKSKDAQVLQDSRAWIAGISDEGGAGSFLAAAMKQAARVETSEIAKLEQFVNETVWGDLQLSHGDSKYGVRKSLFFYDPQYVPGFQYDPSINFGGTWPREEAYSIQRAYDYVHVSAVYWALYKAGAADPAVLTVNDAQWYLKQAYETVNFCLGKNVGYAALGLMGEWVWGEILEALNAEGLTTEAQTLEDLFRARQQVWASQADPFGSEMAYDTTGQEGVYYWSDYFNDTATADKTIRSIRGYMPTIPHWGYNGNARRYWDFLYGGSPQLSRIERQIHHYGSGLNALPMLDSYRRNSDPFSLASLHDLRVGYGGHMGPLSNIDADGFGSMAFHSYADTLQWDAYTGDYGPGFSGHILGAACFLTEHPIFGPLVFGGNIESQNGDTLTATPKDTVRQRLFVTGLGLYATTTAGAIQSVVYDKSKQAVTMQLSSTTGAAQKAILKFEQTSSVLGGKKIVLTTTGLDQAKGGYVLSLPTTGSTEVSFGTA